MTKGMRESGNIYQQIERLLKEGLEQEAANEELLKKQAKYNLYAKFRKGKILIIDDKAAVGAQLLKWCQANEYDVTVACDEREAKAFMKHGRFDAVIRSSEINSLIKRRK